MVGAMNDTDYLGSAACGACARITGPNGEITVRVVDRCPECPEGDIDLSREAFSLIAPLEQGRVPIRWSYVACEVSGPIVYHFKEGSNEFFGAVQIRNHVNPVAIFEWLDGAGVYHGVERADFNFFIEPSGMGPGPYTFRVTDVFGQIVEDAGVPFIEAGNSSGSEQFPACGG
jgi:expansin (peptidoglycan-binding protein)